MIERVSFGIDEVAAKVGCSITTVFKLIREKKLPAKKLGGRTIVLANDLQTFLEGLESAA
ncbi:MAG: helix-turn-helix domain-containing protein [Xanthobacteraceae bacterium]|nr:helix-turn-helix domain-containing protein [Xanthobacteraceae bacterium]